MTDSTYDVFVILKYARIPDQVLLCKKKKKKKLTSSSALHL